MNFLQTTGHAGVLRVSNEGPINVSNEEVQFIQETNRSQYIFENRLVTDEHVFMNQANVPMVRLRFGDGSNLVIDHYAYVTSRITVARESEYF